MRETKNVFNQFPQEGMLLKNELENWLSSTKALIPEIDPLYNEEEEKGMAP